MRRRSTGLFAVASLSLTLLAGLPSNPAQAAPQNHRKGEGQHGLVSAKGKHVAHCADDMYVATESGTCVHGADEARVGVDVTRPRSVEELRAEAYGGREPATPQSVPGVGVPSTDGSGEVVCEGDGVSGKRVQVLYVRTSDVASRFTSLRDTLEQNVLFADQQFNASAAQTGGSRHLRFVTDSDGNGGCTLDLKEVVVPAPTSAFDFGYSVDKVRAAGYTSASRKYLMLTDADYLCGIGSMYIDDTAGTTNASNYYAAEYARVDTGCWHYAEAHELMHNLGGVQTTAPHSSGGGHCYDEYDVMCYSDGGSWFTGPDGISGTADDGAMQYPCAYSQEDFFDCGKDDYFSTSPVAGSYLATHWNSAYSAYLIQPAVSASNTVHVTAPANQPGTFGTPVSPLQVVATDATPGQSLTYSAAGLPAGLSIDAATGIISGTPAEAGPSTVVLTASDAGHAAGSAQFTWTVDAVVPSAPTAPTVTPGRKQLSLSWTTPVDGGSPITSYDVTVTPEGGAPTTTATGTAGTSYLIPNLVNGTGYQVTVAAKNAVGSGPAGPAASGTPSAVAPGVPTGVGATALNGGATVTFLPPADDGDAPVTDYTVTASTGQQVSGSASPLVLSGLSNGVARTFTVTATNDKGASAPSAPSEAVTYWSSSLSSSPLSALTVAGAAVTVSGKLVSGPASARHLTLLTYVTGKATTSTSLTTTSTGTWSASVHPVYTSSYRVAFAGDATHAAVTSVASKVTVKTLITLTSPKNGYRTNVRTVKLYGRTSPNKSGKQVRLYEVRSGGSTAYLGAATVSSTGTFVMTKTLTRGTHVLFVDIYGDTSNAAGRSSRLTVYEV